MPRTRRGRLGIDTAAILSDPVSMYITVVPNRGAKPTTLLRQSYREDKRVKNRTLANLSHLPPYLVETMRRALQGDPLMKASEAFTVDGLGASRARRSRARGDGAPGFCAPRCKRALARA